jgi:hypothetical protein
MEYEAVAELSVDDEVVSRVVTRTWALMDGTWSPDTKISVKYYDSRQKRHAEGEKRRANRIEQLIDHVGLDGVLSGTFTDADDAYHKLTDLQTRHSAAFGSWGNGGRGPLIDDIENDVIATWLDNVIPSNDYTTAMVPWMIGMDFRDYIKAKLNGTIM